MKKVRRVPCFRRKICIGAHHFGAFTMSTVQAMYLPSPGSPTCGPSQGYGGGNRVTETDDSRAAGGGFPIHGHRWSLSLGISGIIYCVLRAEAAPCQKWYKSAEHECSAGTPGCVGSATTRGDEVLHIGV